MKNKYNFAARAVVLTLTLSAAFSFNPSVRAQPPPGPLWYNGDFDGLTGAPNERDSLLGSGQFSNVYGNFSVTGGGWNITEAFSHNLVPPGFVVTGATWEIRSGTTLAHGGGTLVAGGTTAAPVVTVLIDELGFTELEIKVTRLSLFLPVLPAGQFYWLNVTPINDLTSRSFISETIGANCVGTPCGNDGNTFWNSNYFNIKWRLNAVQYPGRDPHDDYSMGVNGTMVPAPTPTPPPDTIGAVSRRDGGN
jgi:hypothetical protein